MSGRVVLVSLSVLLGASIFSATASATEPPVSGTWSKSATGNKVTVSEKNNSGKKIKAVRLWLPPNDVVTEPGLVTSPTPPKTCPDSSIDSMLMPNEIECEFLEWFFGEAIFQLSASDPKHELEATPPPALKEEVSFDGKTYGGAFEVPSGAPPGETPCECANVSAFLNDFAVYPESTRLKFELHWKMTCTAGFGIGCKGKIGLLAPAGMFFVTPPVKGAKGPVRHKSMFVECSGKCEQATEGTASFTLLAIDLRNPKLSPKGRGAGKSLEMVLQTTCFRPNGAQEAPTRLKLKIAFKPNGNVDYVTSDLNGDGRPDGGQLK